MLLTRPTPFHHPNRRSGSNGYGDVHVGTISIRPDVPVDVDQWGEISKTIFRLKLLFENLRSASPGGQPSKAPVLKYDGVRTD